MGISAEFLFLSLYYTVQVAPRKLEEYRKNIPKINIAANSNTVFSELSYEPLSSVMHFFFPKCMYENIYVVFPSLPKMLAALLFALKLLFL